MATGSPGSGAGVGERSPFPAIASWQEWWGGSALILVDACGCISTPVGPWENCGRWWYGSKRAPHEAERAAMLAKARDHDRWKSEAESRAAEATAAMSELSAQRQTENDAIAITQRGSAKPESQQHALHLSIAHSRIRALETEVFEAQAATHTFQRRVTALEAELVQLNTSHTGRFRPFDPSFPAEDSRRHSLSSTRPHTPSSLRSLIVPRAVYDENLSAATRHKRKIHGLSSMAIAEADESLEMHRGERTPRKGSDARSPSVLSEANSQPQSNLELVGGKGKRPAQFLDESHVFWCHSCRGDLVVL
ncbi:hypothetical protein JB92DRAFT_3095731 [Gautieria morchelliformis]|nr:hypothetical protein JB92DRAFT_3095731 [Gautieria morchelliformis]